MGEIRNQQTCDKKVVLPRELQREMLKFFLKTTVPRMKQKKLNLSSENKSDGGDAT